MPKANAYCEDCNGSGEIEVESLVLGRTRYDKEAKGLVIDCQGKGDWHMAQCPCVGEEDDSNIPVLQQSTGQTDQVDNG